MKKIVSLLVFLSLLLNFFALLAAAEPQSRSPISNDIGSITTCEYNAQKKTVSVKGSIYNDKLIEYNDYSVGLFRIPYGSSAQELLEADLPTPIAVSPISIRFDFLVSAQNYDDRFSMYAVAIFNSDNDIKLVCAPKYPLIDTDVSSAKVDKNTYKGFSSEITSLVTSSSADSSIITIELDKLLNESSLGYLYSNSGTYLYFDKEYVEYLDRRINPLLSCGTAVYLRFEFKNSARNKLIPVSSADENAHFVPDMSSAENRELIKAYTDFLIDRYSIRYLGDIKGIILGRKIDLTYSMEGLSIEEYADNYTYLAYTVAEVARKYVDGLELSIPFSDTNIHGAADTDNENESASLPCSPSELLEAICDSFDAKFASRFSFSTHIESSHIPYGISDKSIAEGGFTTDSYDGIDADGAEDYSDYLITLSTKYRCAPTSFVFEWTVPDNISENVLSCAYAYTYLLLMSNNRLSSFVVSFDNCERSGNYSAAEYLFDIIRKIDTEDALYAIDPQREMLGATSWSAIIKNLYNNTLIRNEFFELNDIGELPSHVVGSFNYFDYETHTDISKWYMGSSVDAIRLGHSDDLGKSLQVHFNSRRLSPSDYSEAYYSYEFSENFKFTRYIGLTFEISSGEYDPYAIYEVQFTIGSQKAQAQASAVVKADTVNRILLDISSFSDVSMASFIKIGVRCLSASECTYTLSLSTIKGYSEQNTDEELSALISAERLRIRNLEGNSSASDGGQGSLSHTVIVIVALVACSLGIFFSIRREDTTQ